MPDEIADAKLTVEFTDGWYKPMVATVSHSGPHQLRSEHSQMVGIAACIAKVVAIVEGSGTGLNALGVLAAAVAWAASGDSTMDGEWCGQPESYRPFVETAKSVLGTDVVDAIP